LVRLEGAVAFTEVEKTVMARYHTFIVVNVFVTATLSGAIVDILSFVQEIADNPSLLATLLGTAVPAQAFFFTFYVAQAAIGALVLEVLRITGLIKGYLFRFLAKSARDYRDAFAPTGHRSPSRWRVTCSSSQSISRSASQRRSFCHSR
jgi:hypothetical protein